MAITAADVNKLRQMTGAGMMDCKKALVEADGDFDAAIDILRKKGQQVAAKRADRASSEGRAVAKVNADKTFAAVVVIGCETDFVGKNSDFVEFADSIIDAAIENKVRDIDALNALTIDGSTVAEMILQMTGKTGEKVELAAYHHIEAESVSAYNHNGNRIATIVGFNLAGENVQEAGYNVAMQIAAMNPIALNADAVPQATMDHEMEINRELVRQEGKPENMVEQIVKGKLNKFFRENTLLSQDYIKDNKTSVGDYLKQVDPKLTATQFFRVQIGG